MGPVGNLFSAVFLPGLFLAARSWLARLFRVSAS
jgi:hypothetical protein